MREEFKKLQSMDLYNHTYHDQLAGEEIEVVAVKENLHPILNPPKPIHVTHNTRMNKYGETTTYFNLYVDGEHIGNPIILHYDIVDDWLRPHKYCFKIASKMIEEFLSCCDFTDLDRELEGKCACTEYEGKYKSCDECPLYTYREGGAEDKDNACLGALYTFPHHLNGWKIEEDIKKEFGPGSENYKNYLAERAKNCLHQMTDIIREDRSLKNSILKQLKKL